MNDWYGIAGVALIAVVIAFSWKPLRRLGHEAQVKKATGAFRIQRERLEAKFLTAAGASGKPRGLIWKGADFEPSLTLARDRRPGELVGLVPVSLSFEAVAGGPMEGVAAVGNLRNATAVFIYSRGQWSTTGKAVFNLNPDEAIKHFQPQYEAIS